MRLLSLHLEPQDSEEAYEENNWILWALQPWTQKFNSNVFFPGKNGQRKGHVEPIHYECSGMNTMKYIGALYCFDCFFGSVAVQYQLNIVKTCFAFCDTHWIRNCSLLTWCKQTNTISSDISAELVPDAAMCVFTARPALLLLLLLAAVWCIRGWYLHLWESTRGSCILSLDVHPCGNGPIWLQQIQVEIAN